MEYISEETPSNKYINNILDILKLKNIDYNKNLFFKNKSINQKYEKDIYNTCLLKITNNKNILNTHNLTFFDSGMQAITNIFSTILNNTNLKLYIINPAYDAVYKLCDILKINYYNINLINNNNEFLIPFTNCNIEQSIFFITNPIFSVGCCYSNTTIKQLKTIIQKNSNSIFIIDECIFNKKNSLIYDFVALKNVIFICSPHKILGLEFNKFVAVIANNNIIENINNIKNFVFGLSYTNICLLKNYISLNYDNCYNFSQNILKQNFDSIIYFIESVCNNLYPIIQNFSTTQFITISSKKDLNVDINVIFSKIEFLLDINIIQTKNLYQNKHNKLLFRINLLKDINILKKSLFQINSFLTKYI